MTGRSDPELDALRSQIQIERIIGAEIALTRGGQNVLVGHCPFHPDKSPSLTVDIAHQRFRCWGCDAKGDVFDFLMLRRGIDLAEAKRLVQAYAGQRASKVGKEKHRSERSRSQEAKTGEKESDNGKALRWFNDPGAKCVAIHPYQTNGETVFVKRKYILSDGRKDYPQGIGDGEDFKTPRGFIAGLGEKAWIFYRHDEVMRAIEDDREIFINEGEKATDRMWESGVPATCSRHGATGLKETKTRWEPELKELLRGAKVVIVADRDDVGEHHARILAQELQGIAKSVVIVQSKTLGHKDDAYDHFEAGGTHRDFIQLEPKQAVSRVLGTVSFGDDFESVEPEYVLEPYIQRGKATLWDADGGTHKTGAVIAIAAALSRGVNPLTGASCPLVRTLYLHKGEDLSEELETVFRANGGDSSMISYCLCPDLLLDDGGIELIRNTIIQGGYQLVVFDAFFYFLDGLMKNTNENLPALRRMQPLNAMLAETGAAAISIRHTSKQGKDMPKAASELGMGSQQFRNSHRGQLVARYDPEDPSDNKRVIVTDEKGSLLNRRGQPFAFRRVGNEIQFIQGEIENPFGKPNSGRAKPRQEECCQWLEKVLTGGAVRRDALEERGKEKSFYWSLIAKCVDEMRIEVRNQPTQKRGRPHAWYGLPGCDWAQIEAQWHADEEGSGSTGAVP